MKKAAQIVSTLFHPLLMPAIGLLILFNSDTYINYAVPKELKLFILLLITINTLVIPVLIILFLLHKGFVKSLSMETQKERIIPYLFTILFYIFSLYMLTKIPVPPIIFNFTIGATFSVMAAFLVNLKWKISAHMIGIGGLLGALLCMAIRLEIDITTYILLVLMVAGIIGSSRLILKAHTPLQIYLGFLLGVVCQVVTFI